MSMRSFVDSLNPAQLEACVHPSRVVQIVAPPGSGKTLTLTARLHHFLTVLQIPAHSIILCTFTTRAATEIRERVGRLVGDDVVGKLLIGTFHSIARRFLSRFGAAIGIPARFGIADRDDSIAIVKRVIKQGDYSVEPADARGWISRKKSGKFKCESNKKTSAASNQAQFEDIFRAYERDLEAENLVDFDDLLLRCVDLLKLHPECANFVEAVLVDEFQDSNSVQYEMMKLLACASGRVTVVGDPDQSIYAFRAADVANVAKMRVEMSNVNVVRLVQNYRSSGRIVDLAVWLIEPAGSAVSRPDKMRPTHGRGPVPVLRRFLSPTAEAEFVASETARMVGLSGGLVRFDDVAVLVRTSAQTRLVELALGQAGVPYRLVGGHRFFDRVEVKIVIDYVRLMCDCSYVEGVVRVANVPVRGIGDSLKGVDTAQLIALMAELRENGPDGSSSEKTAPKGKRKKIRVAGVSLSSRALSGLVRFVELVDRGWAMVETGIGPRGIVEFVLAEAGLEDHIRKMDPAGFETRWANVLELVKMAEQIEEQQEEVPIGGAITTVESQQQDAPDSPLDRFLAHIALSSSVDLAGKPNAAVTISTLHAAKGLEWPVVFVVGAFDGSIPHFRAEDVDEERRLLYVGVTRAKAALYMSWSEPKKEKSGGTGEDGTEDSSATGFRLSGKVSRFLAPLHSAQLKANRARKRAKTQPQNRREAAGTDGADLVCWTRPELDFTFYRDVARIVGREVPSESVLSEIRTRLGHQFDPLPDSDDEDGGDEGSESDTAARRAPSGWPGKPDRRSQSHPCLITTATTVFHQQTVTTMTTLQAGMTMDNLKSRRVASSNTFKPPPRMVAEPAAKAVPSPPPSNPEIQRPLQSKTEPSDGAKSSSQQLKRKGKKGQAGDHPGAGAGVSGQPTMHTSFRSAVAAAVAEGAVRLTGSTSKKRLAPALRSDRLVQQSRRTAASRPVVPTANHARVSDQAAQAAASEQRRAPKEAIAAARTTAVDATSAAPRLKPRSLGIRRALPTSSSAAPSSSAASVLSRPFTVQRPRLKRPG